MFDPERRRVENDPMELNEVVDEIIDLGPQDEVLEATDMTHGAIAHRKKQPVEVSRTAGKLEITETKLSKLSSMDAENDDPMEKFKNRQAPDK